jgi:long-chain acyl-CoA synthetase
MGLLVQGDNVMQGYFHLPEDTAQVLTKAEDGLWFHTATSARSTSFIRITDRKKDLIKTSLGKYILHNRLRTRSGPFPGRAVRHRQSPEVPSALIVPNFEALRTYLFTGAHAKGSKGPLAPAEHPQVLQKKVDEVTRNLAPHEKIKKIALLDREFSVDSGELTLLSRFDESSLKTSIARQSTSSTRSLMEIRIETPD